jgi:hypothetical protein
MLPGGMPEGRRREQKGVVERQGMPDRSGLPLISHTREIVFSLFPLPITMNTIGRSSTDTVNKKLDHAGLLSLLFSSRSWMIPDEKITYVAEFTLPRFSTLCRNQGTGHQLLGDIRKTRQQLVRNEDNYTHILPINYRYPVFDHILPFRDTS